MKKFADIVDPNLDTSRLQITAIIMIAIALLIIAIMLPETNLSKMFWGDETPMPTTHPKAETTPYPTKDFGPRLGRMPSSIDECERAYLHSGRTWNRDIEENCDFLIDGGLGPYDSALLPKIKGTPIRMQKSIQATDYAREVIPKDTPAPPPNPELQRTSL